MQVTEYMEGLGITALLLLGWFETSFPGKVLPVITRRRDLYTLHDFTARMSVNPKAYVQWLGSLLSCHICLGVWLAQLVVLLGAACGRWTWTPSLHWTALTWVPVYHFVKASTAPKK